MSALALDTHCLVCNARNIDFTLTNNARRRCPECKSPERFRLNNYYFRKFPQTFSKLLHFAAEPALRPFFREICDEYIMADIAPRKDMIIADITAIDFEDASFDAVVAYHVLEHVEEDAKAMSEVLRILKPGGKFFSMVPQRLRQENATEEDWITTPEDRKKYYGYEGHVRYYGRDFSKRLMDAGFHVTIHYINGIFDDHIPLSHYDSINCIADTQERDKYGLFEWECFFEAEKKLA